MLHPFEARIIDYIPHPELGHVLQFRLECYPDLFTLLQSCPTPAAIARGPWGDCSVEITSIRWPTNATRPIALSTPADLNWRECQTLVLLFRWP